MNKDIKDYLHLYLGCPCVTKWDIYASLVAVWNSKADYIPRPMCKVLRDDAYGVTIDVDPSDLLLILRPLSDMTMDECEDASIICGKRRVYMPIYWQGKGDARFMYMTPDQCFRLTKYLLSKGFDLFGLIEAGLAIDKTKQTVKA